MIQVLMLKLMQIQIKTQKIQALNNKIITTITIMEQAIIIKIIMEKEIMLEVREKTGLLYNE
jgi:hypothetical protein